MRTRLSALALVIVTAASGCASNGDGGTRTLAVGEARSARGDVVVRGYLLLVEVPQTPPRLCTGLTDSVPPRCEEPSMQIVLDGRLPRLEATPDGTHLWSSTAMSVRGSLEDGVLYASETPRPATR